MLSRKISYNWKIAKKKKKKKDGGVTVLVK